MAGFILGVLIISALLSVIFGKRIGTMFATGVLGVAAVLVSVCIVVVVVYVFFVDHPDTATPGYSASRSNYGSGTGSMPAYGSSQTQTYTPVTQTPAPTYQASSPPPAMSTGPRIGVEIAELPPEAAPYMAYLNPPPGAGAWVKVSSGSPAEAAGLKTYDVILSAGTQGQPAQWITPSNQLPDYLDRVGYNVPVRLHVYRKTGPNDFWVWVYPR